MILGNPQQRINQAQDNFNTIVDYARKNQPDRIQIKSIRLHNERLKQLLVQPPQSLLSLDYTQLKTLSIKYEQLVTEFQYCKTAKLSRTDFTTRLRKILDIKDGDNGSNIRSFDNRAPQRFSNSQHSQSSAGGIGKLRYGSKTAEQNQNLVRVPSVAGSSLHNMETANFEFKESGNKMVHKGSYEIRDVIPTQIAPRNGSRNLIHERVNTQVSRIRSGGNTQQELVSKMSKGSNQNNDFPQPLASYQTLQPMKDDIDKMISNQPHTPISDLNQIRQFPKPNNGFNINYFPVGVSQKSIKHNNSFHSGDNNSQKGLISDPQAFGTYGEDSLSVHKNNIQQLWSQADVLKRDNSFKSQMRPKQDREKSRSRSKFRSTKRIRDLSEKEDLIEKLAAENLLLKAQLNNNEGKRQKSQIQQQTYPPGTLEFQKYVISNELLKKENEEIYTKLKDLEEVLEELSKENYLYRGQALNTPGQNRPYYDQRQDINIQTFRKNDSSPQQFYQNPQNVYYQAPRKPTSNGSEKRLPLYHHPLIELPPELGQLIDTQTHRSSPATPVIDYDYRQVHFHAEYRGATEISSRGERSFGNGKLENHSQKAYNQQSGIRVKYDARSESPDFRKSNNKNSNQAYSERDFPEANLPIQKQNEEYYSSSFNKNAVNNLNPQLQTVNNNLDISDDKYFTANNVSVSGDRERLMAQQSMQKKNQFEESKRYNNNQSSDRLYQDFPRMQDIQVSDNNLLSPKLQASHGQLVEKSFDTFKILNNPDSNSNITPTNIIRNSIQKPDNFLNNNRSNLLRNKVAFYKKSLVLVRQHPDFQLAFKKSELNRQLDTIRIIFYVNNKKQSPKTVNFQYQYDSNLYKIKQGDKLSQVVGHSQGRQQLVINCDNNTQQFSFIICHLTVGTTSLDFIVPVFFFKFKSGRIPPIRESATKTINFDKQFSPQFLSTLIPLVHMNPEQYLEFMKGEKPYHGESLLQTSLGQTNLRLEWISGGLRVTTNPSLINAISWTLSDI